MNLWNPRYVAFAASNGLTPEAQLDADRAAYPGGCMVPFMAWISERKAAFRKAVPMAMMGDAIVDHDAFTLFLEIGP